jgi:hypothetical protein
MATKTPPLMATATARVSCPELDDGVDAGQVQFDAVL